MEEEGGKDIEHKTSRGKQEKEQADGISRKRIHSNGHTGKEDEAEQIRNRRNENRNTTGEMEEMETRNRKKKRRTEERTEEKSHIDINKGRKGYTSSSRKENHVYYH